MPLTLDCFCPDDINISLCQLTSLTWIVDAVNGTTGMSVELVGGPSTVGCSPSTVGHCEHNILSDDWIAAWPSLAIRFAAHRSINSIVAESASATWYIEGIFECVRNGEVVSTITKYYNNTGFGGCSVVDGDGFVRSEGFAGPGAASETIFRSSGLGGGGCTLLTDAGFAPIPDQNITIDAETSGTLCLCANGGTPPYKYHMCGGMLPSGQALNPDTGCIVGTPDGVRPGIGPFIFCATDSFGEIAEVTCDIERGCPDINSGIGNDFTTAG
jgi:hypothetical protein